MTPSAVHSLCEKHGVRWDDDPAFMARCKRLTGQERLDDMDEDQLQDVADDVEMTARSASMEKKALAKLAGHSDERLKERAPKLLPNTVARAETEAASLRLDPARTYNMPLPDGSFAVLAPVGKPGKEKHVVKTVLSPGMQPPGGRLPALLKEAFFDELSKLAWSAPLGLLDDVARVVSPRQSAQVAGRLAARAQMGPTRPEPAPGFFNSLLGGSTAAPKAPPAPTMKLRRTPSGSLEPVQPESLRSPANAPWADSWAELKHASAFFDELSKLAGVTVGPPPRRNRKDHPFVGTISFQDLPEVLVENKKGSTRSGTSQDGKAWHVVMPAHYGEFRRSLGTDGDAVDVFVGPDGTSKQVYIVHTMKPPSFKVYDEDKVFIGWTSLAEVRKVFGKAYNKAGFWGGASACSLADLKKILSKRIARGQRLDQSIIEKHAEGFADELGRLAPKTASVYDPLATAFADEIAKLAEPPPPEGWDAGDWDFYLQHGRRPSEHEKTAASRTLKEVVHKANDDPWIKDTVLVTGGARRLTISHHGKVVGFMTPRRIDGVLRLGPVYVRPEYRGQGYASAAIRKATASTPAQAVIDRGNRSSIRAFTAAGFSKVREEGDELFFEKNMNLKKEAEVDTVPALAAGTGALMGATGTRVFDPSWLHPSIVPGSTRGRGVSALLGAGTLAGIASLPSMIIKKKPDPEEREIQ